MSKKPELNPCPFRHIEKDYEHELSVIKDPEKHGLARVCCRCGYRSPVMGFDKESVIVAHNSLADLAKPSGRTVKRIYCAGNKTSSLFFESEKDALIYQSSAGTACGINVWPVDIMPSQIPMDRETP